MFTTLTRYTILVPVYYPDGETLVPPTVLEHVRDSLAARFGGATVESAARGSWIGSDGETVTEPMIPVWALATNGTPRYADEDFIGLLADAVGQACDQEAVLVMADEVRAAFVSAPPVTADTLAA